MKWLIKLEGSQKLHHRIIQKQFQMRRIKKYLKKDIYLQKEDRKLLMIYNRIIMEFQKIINLLDNTPNQPSNMKDKKLGQNK